MGIFTVSMIAVGSFSFIFILVALYSVVIYMKG
jgi:hypothetical protein